MPGYLGVQPTVELTNFLLIKDRILSAASYLQSLARDPRTSGSDIVVEEDVASIFGRGIIQPELEKKFREAVSVTTIKLAASTSCGRASAMGMLQAILQAMLQGAGLVGYCPKC
jgi:hypothetical protein